MILHVFAYHLGNLLIESSQQNRPHHDGDVQTEPGQESAALQGDVGGANAQSLTRAVRQRKQVITATNQKTAIKHMHTPPVKL